MGRCEYSEYLWHTGQLLFGSLIVAIVKAIRIVFNYMAERALACTGTGARPCHTCTGLTPCLISGHKALQRLRTTRGRTPVSKMKEVKDSKAVQVGKRKPDRPQSCVLDSVDRDIYPSHRCAVAARRRRV